MKLRQKRDTEKLVHKNLTRVNIHGPIEHYAMSHTLCADKYEQISFQRNFILCVIVTVIVKLCVN